MDLFDLFKGVMPNAPVSANGPAPGGYFVTTPSALLATILSEPARAATILNAARVVSTKVRKIITEVEEFRHTTGQHSLYLAYPMLYAPTEDGRFVVAPLILWPISLSVDGSKVKLQRSTDNDNQAEEGVLNRILLAWLKLEFDIDLNTEGSEDELNIDTISAEIEKLLSPWRECIKDIPLIAPCGSRADIKTLTSQHPDPCILPWCVLGHGSFKGQALLDDLDKLEGLLSNDPENCGLLKYFLFPDPEKKSVEAREPEEPQKWLVTESDHSQESCIWQTREANVLVLQGPPGTGKSQTIVNLVADALEKEKTVLVVCQKRAALDVVRKRLDAVGLGELVELVEAPSADRARIIRNLKNIETDFDARPLFAERTKICKAISEHEDYLDKATKALHDSFDSSRLSYPNLLARQCRYEKRGYNVYGSYKDLFSDFKHIEDCITNLKELEDAVSRVRNFVDLFKSCEYSTNPWREIPIHLHIPPSDFDKIRSLVFEAKQLAQVLADQFPRRLHGEEHAWFAEHPIAMSHCISLLPENHRQAELTFGQLAVLTRQLGEWIPTKSVLELLESIRSSESFYDQYKNLHESIGLLPTIVHLHKQVVNSQLLSMLFKNCMEQVESWPTIVESFVCQSWIDELRKKHEILLDPSSHMKEMRENLAQLIKKRKRQDIEEIQSRFSSRLENVRYLDGHNLLRLRRAGRIRKTSLRKLYSQGFSKATRLHPVLLTNPESASSMIELKPEIFDLLIIDEASQMYVADTLPLLYRAKTVVVSGDGMQMPPSDFFVSSIPDDEADDESVSEEDEITPDKDRLVAAEGEYCLLDAAEHVASVGTPNRKRLMVHYRSECKELIDFSNYAFYEGRLIAPSGNSRLPDFLRSPIQIDYIPGVFQDGINEIEAQNVIQTVRSIWRASTSHSVGVIVFNVRQKEYILDLLDEVAQADEEFAVRLNKERERRSDDGEDVGFFVRSVEHVQGDERDIIVLATTYSGQTHNFGAITPREKGRRRLNVAVTRARIGMRILTSLDIDNISNEAKAEDSDNYFFWKYMCYARAIDIGDGQEANRILQSLGARPVIRLGAHRDLPDSEFELDVAEFLSENGYHVDFQVGESGFRIDLGVKVKEGDSRYLCGIECDGRQYHAGWKARMNDIWRQSILEKKGWGILRVWSTDWYHNQSNSRKKLLAKLDKMKN